jgi:hypothetical protein
MPSAKLTNAQSEIRAAEAVGAAKDPQAALHLKLARDDVKRAEKFIERGDNEEAELVLDGARVNAEIALTLAESAQVSAEAAEETKKIDMLSHD